MPESWYDVVTGGALEQGDLLPECPVARVLGIEFPLPDDVDVAIDDLDVVVLTQTCDLEHGKVDEVLVALVVAYDNLVAREGANNKFLSSSAWRKQVERGDVPGYCLLIERADDPRLPWSLVDFHHLFSLPKDYVSAFAASVGPRLRLRSPYREHLAQAFARYIMRVGLPLPGSGFTEARPSQPT